MNKPLDGLRILVADDQTAVARTLCDPLANAGARLTYVADGEAAVEAVDSQPFDLALLDMKMPPREWGGLWVMRTLIDKGWRIPVIALSGEGSKQQVIEALRLGAANWVDKDQAGAELLACCTKLLDEDLASAVERVRGLLPTPMASRLAKYARTTDTEKKATCGLQALEAILQFTALVGLATTAAVPLAGITAERMKAPSMGTWFDVCAALADTPSPGRDFAALFSWLAPLRKDRQAVRAMVNVRNDLAHGRAAPAAAQRQQLDALLQRFAHRAAAGWRAAVAVPVSMTFDGAEFVVEGFDVRGDGAPERVEIRTERPLVSGSAYLVPFGGGPVPGPVPLSPWIVTEVNHNPDKVRCFQFDGVQRPTGGGVTDSPLRLAACDGGPGPGLPSDGRWSAVTPWLAL